MHSRLDSVSSPLIALHHASLPVFAPVGKLKSIVNRLLSTGDARLVKGGDNDASEMILLPLKKIMEVV